MQLFPGSYTSTPSGTSENADANAQWLAKVMQRAKQAQRDKEYDDDDLFDKEGS